MRTIYSGLSKKVTSRSAMAIQLMMNNIRLRIWLLK